MSDNNQPHVPGGLFHGCIFFWVPDRWDNNYEKARWRTAEFHGATNWHRWREDITHVIVNDDLTHTDAVNKLYRRQHDHRAPLVRYTWISSSIELQELQAVDDPRYAADKALPLSSLLARTSQLTPNITVPFPTIPLVYRQRPGESWRDFAERLPPYLTRYQGDQTEHNTFQKYPYRVQKPQAGNLAAQKLVDFGQAARSLLEDNEWVATMYRQRVLSTSGHVTDFGDAQRVKNEILSLARQHQVIWGFWILRIALSRSIEVWERVAQLTEACELGRMVDLLPGDAQSRDRVFRIYTEDFDDQAAIHRLLRSIYDNEIVPKSSKLYYKPLCLEMLSLKSGNRFGMRTSLYEATHNYFELQEENLSTAHPDSPGR